MPLKGFLKTNNTLQFVFCYHLGLIVLAAKIIFSKDTLCYFYCVLVIWFKVNVIAQVTVSCHILILNFRNVTLVMDLCATYNKSLQVSL